jgi:signal transduction histidine kinase
MMRTLGLVSATLILALSWMIMLARKYRALRDQVLARKRAEAGLQLAHDKLEERVEERSRQLEEQIHARHDAEIEFQTVLRERNRLAAELHDTLEQGLTGVALQLEAADLSSAGSSNGLKRHITLARDLVRQSQTEVRRSIWDLKSSALERNDLAGALREIGVYLTEGSGVRIEVGVTGPVRALPDLLENHLLRIGQESITNAMKHAGPRRIEVSLDFAADAVCLKVRDDGSGFATGDRRSLLGEHFGLNGMRERAKRVGGKFQVESKPGAGTTITASVPLGAEIMADSGKSAGVRIPAEPAPRALGELASLK